MIQNTTILKHHSIHYQPTLVPRTQNNSPSSLAMCCRRLPPVVVRFRRRQLECEKPRTCRPATMASTEPHALTFLVHSLGAVRNRALTLRCSGSALSISPLLFWLSRFPILHIRQHAEHRQRATTTDGKKGSGEGVETRSTLILCLLVSCSCDIRSTLSAKGTQIDEIPTAT